MDFVGTAIPLSPGDIEAEAAALGCDPAAIHAVCEVEAAGSGFLSDGRPKILFEAHLFSRNTRGRWDGQYPNISAPAWDKSLYGAGGAHQYERLELAIGLDRDAALRSASWGMFQVLGSNFRICGFASPETLVMAMEQSEARHLDAFVKFCTTSGISRYLKTTPPDFANFSRMYNGPGYAANAYDTKLAAAWRKWVARTTLVPNPAPRTEPQLHYRTLQLGSCGDDVADLQCELGVSPNGDFDPVTLAAVVSYQLEHGLVPDGIVGPATRAALEKP